MANNNHINENYDHISLSQVMIDRTKLYLKKTSALFTKRFFSLPPELANDYEISEILERLKEKTSIKIESSKNPERPIFIFSAGWRSGSTLLQRLIVSSGEIMIWGEPHGNAAIIPRLGQSFAAILHEPYLESFYFNKSNDSSDLSNQWIANITPDISYLKYGQRDLLHKWLGASSEEKFGKKRWGLKEVRLSIEHAKFLKWLFPEACFLFILRNPLDAYRSWKGNTWPNLWPNYHSSSPAVFARHWRHLVKGYLNHYSEVNGMIIKFEDLISNKVEISKIAHHIGVSKLDKSVLEKKIATTGDGKVKVKKRLSLLDRITINIICSSLMKRLDYKK